MEVVNNWRSCHAYPLNTFQMNLRRAVKRVMQAPGLVSQRTKRLPAIKLKLYLNPNMQLSQMQDLGGCRAVVRSVRRVNELVNDYMISDAKHEFKKGYDYITNPKDTGYRSVHLVFKHYSDKKGKEPFNGMLIEIQIRSRDQHAWATAVETVGEFIGQALKSNLGDEKWRRFFALMGCALAFEERTTLVPNTPHNRQELIEELRKTSQELNVIGTLTGIGRVFVNLERTKDAHYFLVSSAPETKEVSVQGFTRAESEKALSTYSDAERTSPNSQVVLVSADSMQKVKKAYPSYFFDSRLFIDALHRALVGRVFELA